MVWTAECFIIVFLRPSSTATAQCPTCPTCPTSPRAEMEIGDWSRRVVVGVVLFYGCSGPTSTIRHRPPAPPRTWLIEDGCRGISSRPLTAHCSVCLCGSGTPSLLPCLNSWTLSTHYFFRSPAWFPIWTVDRTCDNTNIVPFLQFIKIQYAVHQSPPLTPTAISSE